MRSPISQSAPSPQCSRTRARLLRLHASRIGARSSTPVVVLLHQPIQLIHKSHGVHVAKDWSPPKNCPTNPKVGANIMPATAETIKIGTSFAREKLESNP